MGIEYTRLVTILGQIPFANRIIISDNFEGLLKWQQYEGTGDSIFELDPTIAKHGNQSLYMKTRTTAHAEDDTIGAEKTLHLLPTKILILLNNFLIPSYANTKILDFAISWFDATSIHTAGIRYLTSTYQWQYYSPGETHVNIPNANVPLLENIWHFLKMDINLGENRYISLQIDHMLFDLSTFLSFSELKDTHSNLSLRIVTHASAVGPGSLYIDDTSMYEL